MSDVKPFFLYGALRSGTTLLRLMLHQHSGIHSHEEADFLFDHAKARAGDPADVHHDREAIQDDVFFRLYDIAMPAGQGAELTHALVQAISDKVPGSTPCLDIHRNVGMAAAQFPQAKFIHLLRDPRDVARSSIGMGWCGHSYYGVSHWIETEQQWDAAALPPARVLTVRFEDFILDIESGLRDICDFVGLPYDPEMVTYHQHASYAPPDPSIAYKWKKKPSRDIALIEGRASALIEARGYALTGPATPGKIEALRLSWQNRLKRWQYNIRRYGLKLFVGHHIARALGLRDLEKRLAGEQENIRIQNFQ